MINQNPNTKKVITSQKVNDFSEIMTDANAMFAFMKTVPIPTLHHSELIGMKKPFNFFVVNKIYRFMFHGHGLIINPKLVAVDDQRTIEEACAQFPFRANVRIRRYNKITIECYVENPQTGRLEMAILDLIGDAAYVTQHNIDHARGILLHGGTTTKKSK